VEDKGADPEFIEGDVFKTIIPFTPEEIYPLSA